jgi:hypothetical protein
LHLQLTYPYLFVTNIERRSLGFVALSGPFLTTEQETAYTVLRRRFRFVGFSSYVDFPCGTGGGFVRDYASMCEGWCHGFRDPSQFIPAAAPRTLISQSDFIDPEMYSTGRVNKDLDFVYVCGDGNWRELVKNWRLAQRCIPRFCAMGLRGALVGCSRVSDMPPLRNVETHPFLPRLSFYALLERARFIFVPSVLDASPRVLCEAMCMNTAILVQRDILAGWKYVNDETGAFFSDENDIESAVRKCYLVTSPRQWFTERFGPTRTGARLSRFLSTLAGAAPPPGAAILSSVCRDVQ